MKANSLSANECPNNIEAILPERVMDNLSTGLIASLQAPSRKKKKKSVFLMPSGAIMVKDCLC